MKRSPTILAHPVVLVALAALATALAIKLVPALSTLSLSFSTPAGAAALSVQPAAPLTAAGNGFTYQGRLKDGTGYPSGQFDIVFTLYDAPSAGGQVGVPVTDTNQSVSEGLFAASLDFGPSAFDGSARYLELAVRPAGSGPYTTLGPRQPITPAPYALFALKTQGYKNVLVVAGSGGDFTSIQAALDSIADNSAANRYLVYVAPGVYTETVTMKPYVDIEGSGEKTTKITFTGSVDNVTGTVVGADDAELRSLSVENTGGNAYAIAIYSDAASPSLLDVTATASGSSQQNSGVYNFNASTRMNNVTVVASGPAQFNYGVINFYGSPTLQNSNVSASGATATNRGLLSWGAYASIQNSTIGASGTASYGIYALLTGLVTVDNSTVSGAYRSISADYDTTLRVGSSKVVGGPLEAAAGYAICADVHDGNGMLLPGNCLNSSGNVVDVAKSGARFSSIQAALASITDNSAANRYVVRVSPGTYAETITMKPYVDIEGSGEKTTRITFTGSASTNTGTVVGANNAELRSLSVENTGGSAYAIAIYTNGASPGLLNVTATGAGASTANFGVYNTNSSPAMTNVRAGASGTGTSLNIGVENNGGSAPVMVNVTASASGGSDSRGVNNTGSSPRMTGMTISASGATNNYGVDNSNSTTRIYNSTITAGGGTGNYGLWDYSSGSVYVESSVLVASTNTIFNDGSVAVRVASSKLEGGPISGTNTSCSGVHDENFTFFAGPGCP
jgi:pectin methylesterase-like acyl-CoA thioesterase